MERIQGKVEVIRLSNMKYILLFISLVVFTACGSDDVVVSVKDISVPFLPAADDNSEEATLRRRFYSEYGSYLLFNDTLQHELVGVDANGDAKYDTELIDVDYEIGMSTSTNNVYRFELLNDIEAKRGAVVFLEDYILSHISGKLAPFSWLIVNNITCYDKGYGVTTKPYAVIGQRTVVVAAQLLPRLSAAQKEQYKRQVMNIIIAQLALDHADMFAEMYALSIGNYGGTFDTPDTNEQNTHILAEAGFICRGSIDIMGEKNGCYPSKELDVKAFARLVAANTQAAVEARYADYPLVIAKAAIMRKILTTLGYKE